MAPKRPRDRKASIVAAAAHLWADQGFAAVSMDDIAAAVGVTGSALYRHFPGKDALLHAVASSVVEPLAELVEAARGGGLDPAFVRHALGHPDEVATYLRERGRLAGERDDHLQAAETRLDRAALTALRRSFSGIDERRARVRVYGVLGALSATPRGRPAPIGLLTGAATAAWATPPVAGGPAVAEPKWRLPATRSEELLAAALALFRSRGFRGVGIDEISEAAGISGSALYRHFESKADLLVEAYDRAGARVMVGAEQALAGAGSAAEALDRLSRSYAQVTLDSADLIAVTSREHAALPDSERPRLARRRRALQEMWTAVVHEIRPGLGDADVRLLVGSTLELMHAAALAAGPGDDLSGEVAALATSYCQGA